MKQKKCVIIITLLLLTFLVSCDKESKTVNDNLSENTPTIQIQTNETDQELEENEDHTEEEKKQEAQDTSQNGNITVTQAVTDTQDQDQIIEFTLLENPPVQYYLSDKASNNKVEPVRLNIKLNEENNIIDDNEWLSDNNHSLNMYYLADSFQSGELELPEDIVRLYTSVFVTSSFRDDSYIYVIYGANYAEGYLLNIYDVNTHDRLYSLDFTNYKYSPEYVEEDYDYIQQKINWVVIKDNILYVSNSHRTYAKSSNNMNGYITAFDLSDMSMLWRSDPLISNSYNFQIFDDIIFCGYGFTNENDYLYELNRYTGEIIATIPLKSAPSYIFIRDNTLFVRTYNTNYEFEIK